jgi:ribosome biogenesis GTPase / thiamine phosphate phosphatase
LPTFTRLAQLGWDDSFAQKFKQVAGPGDVPARVIADFGADYLVDDGVEQRRAEARRVDPAVGDWVALRGSTISGVVERRTQFSRRAAGVETREQILAANIDVAFVVAAANDVNIRRIERYLTIAWQSGAAPVVLLTKADLVEAVEAPALPAQVIVVSSVSGQGIDAIQDELAPDKTGVLLGPSGVGKSTLINTIVGAVVMRTRDIHAASGEGRHMTSHRQLIQLPEGGSIIDTPGLREAQLWEGDDAMGNIFEDIEELSSQCRFTDCRHETEPDCAVKNAIADGTLDAGRLHSYRKLKRELRAVAAKSDARLRAEDRKKWKLMNMAMRRARP